MSSTPGRLSIPGIQCKLAVSQPGDPQEQEADRIARIVMDGGHSPPQRLASTVQRKCAQCEDEEQIQRKAAVAVSVRDDDDESEQAVMRAANSSRGDTVPGSTTSVAIASSRATGGVPLAPELRGFFEPRLGADLSRVRIHTGEAATAAAHALRARAFTLGPDVFFPRSEWRPRSRAGRELLAHELVHTVQQGGAPRRLSAALGLAGPLANSGAATVQRKESTEDAPAPTPGPVVFESVVAVVGAADGHLDNPSQPFLGVTEGGAEPAVRPGDVVLIRLKEMERDLVIENATWVVPKDARHLDLGKGVHRVVVPSTPGAPPMHITASVPGSGKSARLSLKGVQEIGAHTFGEEDGYDCHQPCGTAGSPTDGRLPPGAAGVEQSSERGKIDGALKTSIAALTTALSRLNAPQAVEQPAFRRSFLPDGVLNRLPWAERLRCRREARFGRARRECREDARVANRQKFLETLRFRVIDALAVAKNNLVNGPTFYCPDSEECCKSSSQEKSAGFTKAIGKKPSIFLCPGSFAGGDTLPRNIVHEAVHSAGVGIYPHISSELYREASGWSNGVTTDTATQMADAYAWYVFPG